MGIKKEYIILALIIIGLSAYLIVQKQDKTHYTLPEFENIEKNDISKMVINRKGSDVTLSREKNGWYILPHHYPADSGMVESMLVSISTLSLTALASESKNYTPYELDENNRIEVTAFKEETPLRSVSIGKAASSFHHTFVKLADDYRVFHAAGNLRNFFDKTVSGLRDKEVLKIDDEITDLKLRKGEDEITIVRKSPPVTPDPDRQKEGEQVLPAQKWETPDGKPAVDSEVDDIVNTLSGFTCDEYIDDKAKEDFVSPVYSVSLRGLKEYTISFFDKTDNKYPAVSSENHYPFFVSSWKAERIMKDLESLLVPESK
jgi:hypothetical protein